MSEEDLKIFKETLEKEMKKIASEIFSELDNSNKKMFEIFKLLENYMLENKGMIQEDRKVINQLIEKVFYNK